MSKISELVGKCQTVTLSDELKSGFNSERVNAIIAATCTKEAVDHPLHYQSKTGLEAIDVIEAFELNFNLGNVVKYILRCGKKDAEILELEKAKWYLEHEIYTRKSV